MHRKFYRGLRDTQTFFHLLIYSQLIEYVYICIHISLSSLFLSHSQYIHTHLIRQSYPEKL